MHDDDGDVVLAEAGARQARPSSSALGSSSEMPLCLLRKAVEDFFIVAGEGMNVLSRETMSSQSRMGERAGDPATGYRSTSLNNSSDYTCSLSMWPPPPIRCERHSLTAHMETGA